MCIRQYTVSSPNIRVLRLLSRSPRSHRLAPDAVSLASLPTSGIGPLGHQIGVENNTSPDRYCPNASDTEYRRNFLTLNSCSPSHPRRSVASSHAHHTPASHQIYPSAVQHRRTQIIHSDTPRSNSPARPYPKLATSHDAAAVRGSEPTSDDDRLRRSTARHGTSSARLACGGRRRLSRVRACSSDGAVGARVG